MKKFVAALVVANRWAVFGGAILFGVKKKDGFPVSNYLQTMSGHTVDYGMTASAKK